MALKRFSCRTHGGVFTKESTRGRPPVRCAEGYLCDKAEMKEGILSAKASEPAEVSAPDFHSMTNAELKAYAREHFSTIGKVTSRGQLITAMEAQLAKRTAATSDQRAEIKSVVREVPGVGKVAVITGPRAKPAESNGNGRTPANDSLPLAMRAKAQLEAVGWIVKGRAWLGDGSEPDGFGAWAEVTASRGAETLIMRWCNGVLMSQDYSLEHLKESDNGIPGRKLDFDPNELTDGELVQKISGMKVTWWNTLASSTETAIIPGNMSIEHLFVGGGDTDNHKRIVKFIEHGGRGFRAFHVGALMKVG